MASQVANKTGKKGEAGFTLVELIMVIVVIGILAAMALPRFGSVSGQATTASTALATSSENTRLACMEKFPADQRGAGGPAETVCGTATSTLNVAP